MPQKLKYGGVEMLQWLRALPVYAEGPEFSSTSTWWLTTTVIPVLGAPMPSSDLLSHQAHM